MEIKKCGRCLYEKELESFPIQKNTKDNHSSWCKSCHSEYAIKHNNKENRKKYYDKYKDKIKVLCECGKYIFKHAMKKHLESKIHYTRLSDHLTKVCNGCKQTKDINLFYENKHVLDKHSSMCKTCDLEHMKMYYHNKKRLYKTN